ncbi:MAG: 3'-5' exonuclease [Longimicrobiales bacterium]|nr:3'-5' exonuclease [Longimicrobiales bacterium]
MKLPLALDHPLIFFDLETTGVDPKTDRIVELALIRVSPQGDVLERVRRFNPEMPIPPGATEVHGITDADVADEATFAQRARALAHLLDGCDLAGFNILRFDLPLLDNEFHRAGVPFSVQGRRLIDMQTIFHREEPRDLTAAARFYLKREHPEAHTALGDIRTSAAVLSAQLEHYAHLPRDLEGLHRYCAEVSGYLGPLSDWFRLTDGELALKKGKHRGLPLDQVARIDADYLLWIRGLDDTRAEVAEAIDASIARAHSDA